MVAGTIEWSATRRQNDVAVRCALTSLSARQAEHRAAPNGPRSAHRPNWPDVAIAVGLTPILLVGVVALGLGAVRGESLTCEPVTYTVEGSPPQYVQAELSVAMQEVERRSGLVFAEGPPSSSKLAVIWSSTGVSGRTPSASVSGGGTRRVGFGEGRWRTVKGGRELVAGVVEVDATRSWSLGIDRGDGLAAVFAHELGHVVGLPHNAEPTSFMHHSASRHRPSWTPDELEQLELAGAASGCSVFQESGAVVGHLVEPAVR